MLRIRYAGWMLLENIIEIRDDTPHSAALNMALDEVLLADAVAPLLRIYRWERPAVSFGYFGKYAPVAKSWAGREIVRRMTGGGIVPHGEDLTYSLIVPGSHAFAAITPREVYRRVHETIGSLIAKNGTQASLAQPPTEIGTGACFESPAEFDLLTQGRKVAGAALRRTRHGLLLQGSIQDLPDLESLRPILTASFGKQVSSGAFAKEQLACAETLAAEKYGRSDWTMRV